ncbi:MAG: single-stranded-DNA-specific exonuclease RecJ, partial [Pseudomonadales bacterium]|nr:single-stranded-DNA-specific exonuclease RecJ [Pseudomonadales bacterium]
MLITDHHLPGEALPAADAIVNPNQPGCGFESRALAGVGVAFYLLSRLRKVLEARGWFAGAGISPPAMAGFLDLVALGTVADVVPLDRNNRILVAQGLRRIRAGKCSAGIRTLLSVSGTNLSRVSTRDLAFGAAPRLNAAGRLDDMSIGIACLLAEDDQQALLIAARLDQLNRERREIEKEMKADAEEILKQETARHIRQDQKEQPAGLCLYAAGWHQGVVGILASRIKDRVNRPVIAFAADDEGNLKGSGRSIKGFHIRDALAHIDAMNPGMISRFGGHAMAAGLTLPAPHLQQFRDCFNHLAGQWLSAEALEMTIVTDGELTQKLSVKDVHEVLQSMPWGQGFPEPLFDGEFQIIDQRIVGGRHLKLK